MSASICHRCGSRVICREFAEGKVTVMTISQLLETAFWCSTCDGLLCAACGGLSQSQSEVALMLGPTAFCPVCRQSMSPAEEHQMTHAISPRLRTAPARKGFFARLVGPQPHPPGTLAYLFTVTQHQALSDREAAANYLQSVKEMCVEDPQRVSDDAKLAAVWETDPVDRAQLVKWASETFGEGFEQMSTKYDLTFVRFEHMSGNGQVLIAHHRA